MVVPQFIRFYGMGYGAVMDCAARTFYALLNAMFMLQADEALDQIAVASVPHADDGFRDGFINELRKRSRGLSGIVREVRNIREK